MDPIYQEAAQLIAQFGFPIFITLWFMLRTEKVITNNTLMIQNNSAALGEIKGVMEKCKR